MAGNERSKLKLLYLVRFFEEKTDEDNGVSMGEILKYLGENGISAERKSIYRDLECLREFGYDIEKRGKPARYYLTTRDFDFDELEYLFKSVESARFISKEKTEKMLEKLKRLTSEKKASEIRSQAKYIGRNKKSFNGVKYANDTIFTAINQKKKVCFRYADTKFGESTDTVLRHDGKVYHVSPWAKFMSNENYYCIAREELDNASSKAPSNGKNQAATYRIVSFRIDRMRDVMLCEDEPRIEPPRDFDQAQYINTSVNMYGGEMAAVVLRVSSKIWTVVTDRYASYSLINKNEDFATIRVAQQLSTPFYAWVFSFGNEMQIIEPKEAVKDYRALLADALCRMDALANDVDVRGLSNES